MRAHDSLDLDRLLGLPSALGVVIEQFLPAGELLLGGALLLGIMIQLAAALAISLLLAFCIGVALATIRGTNASCQCFGSFLREPVGWSVLIRDGILAALAGVLFVSGARVFTVDELLNPQGTTSQLVPVTDLIPVACSGALVIVSYLLVVRALGLEAEAIRDTRRML